MSFADELRNAPDERKKEEERQRQLELEQQKSDWFAVINEWYKYIQAACKKAARNDKTSCVVPFERAIQSLYDDAESSEETPEWLKRVTSRIRCQLNPKNSATVKICLSEEDIRDAEEIIRKRLELDGLTAQFQREQYQKYRLERVFIKRSEGERAAVSIFNAIFPSNTAGFKNDAGHYANRKVEDGFRYGISVTVSW